MNFVDSLLDRLQTIEASLRATYIALRQHSDDDALHQLRVGLRSLRSLLRPLRKMDDCASVYAAATELGRLSNPARDLEVLIAELERCGLRKAARARRTLLKAHYISILTAPAMHTLFHGLDACLTNLHAEARGLREHQPRIRRHLRKQFARLQTALADLRYDRHRLRLLVKRARYAHEAYPTLLGLHKNTTAQLKALQAALGNWHDHHQWCLRAEEETDLASLLPAWQTARTTALVQAEVELRKLLRLLERAR